MADDGELTAQDVNNNLVLKKELLSLIKYNGREIATDNVTLSYYNITVSQETDHYVIEYVFNNNVSTYTRTLKMKSVIEATSLDTDKYMAYNSTLGTAITDKTALTSYQIENIDGLKTELLGLIKFNGVTISTDDAVKFAINVVKNSNDYSVTYTYNGTGETYTRTFKMALS